MRDRTAKKDINKPPPQASFGGWWLATVWTHLKKSVRKATFGGKVAGGWWLGG